MLLRRGALISKQPIYQYLCECRCEGAFSESYTAVSLVDVTKFACVSLEFFKTALCISNGVKNCFRTRKKVLRFDVLKWNCKLLCEVFDSRYSIIFDNFERFKFRITTKRFKLVETKFETGAFKLLFWLSTNTFLKNSHQSDHYFIA